MEQLPGSLAWISVILALYYWNVPLSVLGRWFHGHKTTILRWIIGLAVALGPILYGWIVQHVKASKVYVDEKWLKIGGQWHYWYVVLDGDTELPVVTALLRSRTKAACRWIGCLLRQLGKIPRVVITDG